MIIFGFYIINKSGGIIYNYDDNIPKQETKKTYNFPLPIKLEYKNDKVVAVTEGGDVEHALVSVNGSPVTGRTTEDGRDVFDIIGMEANYPLRLKFLSGQVTTKEMLAEMVTQLVDTANLLHTRCSGVVSMIEETYKLSCFHQPVSGANFILVTEPFTSPGVLLRKVRELHAEYVVKEPNWDPDAPICCEVFETALIELLEKSGTPTLYAANEIRL